MSTALAPPKAGTDDFDRGEVPFALSVTRVLLSDLWPSEPRPLPGDDPASGAIAVEAAEPWLAHSCGATYLARLAGLAFGGSWNEVVTRIESDLSTSWHSTPVKGIGSDPHPQPAAATRVRQVKDDSGLTWNQFRRLFGVSQRSVHLWASGGRMNARNEERLAYIEQVVSTLGLATAQQRRDTLLMSPPGGGPSIFQQLARSTSPTAPIDIEALTESSGAGPTIHGEFLFAEEIGDSRQTR